MWATIPVLTITVCDACLSDWCWHGLMFCPNYLNAGTQDVPACQVIVRGKQCARPESMHDAAWAHRFTAATGDAA
jgi:hypothetical protein